MEIQVRRESREGGEEKEGESRGGEKQGEFLPYMIRTPRHQLTPDLFALSYYLCTCLLL